MATISLRNRVSGLLRSAPGHKPLGLPIHRRAIHLPAPATYVPHAQSARQPSSRRPHSTRLNTLRHFTCTPARQHPSTAAETFPDPDRPDLFYHLFTPPTSLSATTPIFALSFLSAPPPSILSASVVGWLPASGAGDGAGLNDFVENGACLVLAQLRARVRG